MKTNHSMTTLSEAMELYRKEGYNADFNIDADGIVSGEKKYDPKDLTVVKTLRFEGSSDPADMSILYIIEAKDGTKGMYIDAYGTYAAQDGKRMDEFIKDMNISENHSKD
jgi:hypothetical protein